MRKVMRLIIYALLVFCVISLVMELAGHSMIPKRTATKDAILQPMKP